MQMHEHKFELLVHRIDSATSLDCMPFALELYSYVVSEGVMLSPTSELRDLGVQVSADLSWKSQIASVESKGRSIAAWILNVFRSREPMLLMTLCKTYVRSPLEYCSLLWHPQNIEDIELIEGA